MASPQLSGVPTGRRFAYQTMEAVINDGDDEGPHECDHTTSFVISLTMTVPGPARNRASARSGLARTF